MPNILVWDIETSHLKADFDTLLAFGAKYVGSNVTTVWSLDKYRGWRKDPLNDRKLLMDVKAKLEAADIWVTFNGKRFDVPYVQAKLMEHGLGVLPNPPHVDLYQIARHRLAISRRSLEKVGYFLGIEETKTPVEGRIWKQAIAGNAGALSYIVSHCASDVELTEKVYLALRPLVRLHPRVANDFLACRVCGSYCLHRRGKAATVNTGPRIRFQCQACGAWENRKEAA